MTSLSPSFLLAHPAFLRRSSVSALSLRLYLEFRRLISAASSMSTAAPLASSTTAAAADGAASSDSMNHLLFVEMGVGYDQRGQDIYCRCDEGLQGCYIVQLHPGVPQSGKILNLEVVDGGLICSSGVYVEEMGDKNEDCYIVNAAVYVGY